MRCFHLFNGIGGFALAASWMGWENVAHCENNEFCNQVMNRRFPNSVQYGDITTTDFSVWRGRIDLVTGGFPCQPFSNAGQQLGTADPRYLWPQMFRAIREIQPPWVVAENVPGFVSWRRGMAFEGLHVDLEAEGYETTSFLIPAAGVNAPHKRERLRIIAYSHRFYEQRSTGPQKLNTEGGGNARGFAGGDHALGVDTNAGSCRQLQPGRAFQPLHIEEGEDRQIAGAVDACGWITEPPVCGANDGVPDGVDRLTSLGNAVVPQVVFQVYQAIERFKNFL